MSADGARRDTTTCAVLKMEGPVLGARLLRRGAPESFVACENPTRANRSDLDSPSTSVEKLAVATSHQASMSIKMQINVQIPAWAVRPLCANDSSLIE